MSSLRKITAARANGAKSRGPVTPEGRSKIAFNAIRHGLTAKSIVLSNESNDRYQELFDTYIASFQPVGEHEFSLVENLVAVIWRQRRLWGIESALLDVTMDCQQEEIAEKFKRIDQGIRLALAFGKLADEGHALSLLCRYESRLRRDHDRILDRLHATQAARRRAEAEHTPTLVAEPEPTLPEPLLA